MIVIIGISYYDSFSVLKNDTTQVALSQSIEDSVSGESQFTSMNGNTVLFKRDPDDGTISADGMTLTRCPDKCHLKVDPGPCEALIPRLNTMLFFINPCNE